MALEQLQRVSFSRLQQFEACPRQYFFKAELKLPEAPSKSLVLGNVVHTLAAEIMMGRPPAEVDRMAEELVAKEPLLEPEEDLPVVLSMSRAAQRFRSLGPQVERQVEQWLEVDIGEGVCLRGKADLIEIASDRIRITDWKTNFKAYGINQTQQLDLYALCLAQRHPGRPVTVQLRFLRYGERKGLDARESTPADQQRVREWACQAAAAIQEAHRMPWLLGFSPAPGRACKTCPYAPQCLVLRAQELGVSEEGGLNLLRAVLEGAFAEPTDGQTAAEIGGWVLVLERALEIMRQWLRLRVERTGPVQVGGREFGLYFSTGWELRDPAGFFKGLQEALAEHAEGEDPWSYFRLDADKVKRLAATPIGKELLAEYAEQVVSRSYFSHRDAQAPAEEGAGP